jgi:hypothetical protein
MEGSFESLSGVTVDRKKSGVEQVSPLTPKAREVLEQIRAEKKNGAIVANLQNLVFTLNEGTPITRGLIRSQSTRRQECRR